MSDKMNNRNNIQPTENEHTIVLIVDDDPAIRYLVKENLEPNGFRAFEAESGNAALNSLEHLSPDIILLDIMMPGMDGFEVCRQLRTRVSTQATPILVMTALEDISSIERAYSLGATDFITKPLNWSILPHRVRFLVRAKKAMESALINETRLEEAQRIAHIGNWEWDIRQDHVFCSEEVFRIFGVDSNAIPLTYQGFTSRIHELDRTGITGLLKSAMESGTRSISAEHRITQENGEIRHVNVRAEIIFNNHNTAIRVTGIVQDITERKVHEERMRQLAYYDELTGLPNRFYFQDQLSRAIASAKRQRKSIAVIVMDLDHFRRINDSLGHDVGDLLIKRVSEVLHNTLRQGDYIARFLKNDEGFARMGGDEFALMLPGIVEVDQVNQIAHRICSTLQLPIKIMDSELVISASIGIAFYPKDGLDTMTLLKNADSAMFAAKESGRAEFHYYSKGMHEKAIEHLVIEEELRYAIQEEELLLYYQPKLDIVHNRIIGAEALIRWQSPKRGLVMPDRFIPIAEHVGLIRPITDWVAQEACRQTLSWINQGITLKRLAINISGQQLRDRSFPVSLSEVLAKLNIPANILELELTETTLLRMIDQTFSMLHTLKDQGFTLAIDDFGTGYSSLTYLRRLPVDVIKIDRSFIMNIDTNHDDRAIVSAIVNMGKSLHLDIVAEGVETQGQLDYLCEIECNQAQGYFIAHPMPAEEFANFYREYNGEQLISA